MRRYIDRPQLSFPKERLRRREAGDRAGWWAVYLSLHPLSPQYSNSRVGGCSRHGVFRNHYVVSTGVAMPFHLCQLILGTLNAATRRVHGDLRGVCEPPGDRFRTISLCRSTFLRQHTGTRTFHLVKSVTCLVKWRFPLPPTANYSQQLFLYDIMDDGSEEVQKSVVPEMEAGGEEGVLSHEFGLPWSGDRYTVRLLVLEKGSTVAQGVSEFKASESAKCATYSWDWMNNNVSFRLRQVGDLQSARSGCQCHRGRRMAPIRVPVPL